MQVTAILKDSIASALAERILRQVAFSQLLKYRGCSDRAVVGVPISLLSSPANSQCRAAKLGSCVAYFKLFWQTLLYAELEVLHWSIQLLVFLAPW